MTGPDPVAKSWLAVALEASIVRRSLRVAAVVGTLLVAINHGDRAMAGTMLTGDWIKVALTYCVPYGVATFAAVQAVRQRYDGR